MGPTAQQGKVRELTHSASRALWAQMSSRAVSGTLSALGHKDDAVQRDKIPQKVLTRRMARCQGLPEHFPWRHTCLPSPPVCR